MQINYESLNYIVTKNDIYNTKKQLNNNTSKLSQSIASFIVISAISPFLVVTIMIFGADGFSLNISWVLFWALILVALVLVFNKYQTAKWEKITRLVKFAKQNNLMYRILVKDPIYSGMIFSIGDSRLASDLISDKDGNVFEIANYQYSTGSGKNRHTTNYGYIKIKLDRNLPHMVLDSVKNNANILGMSFSNLPLLIDKDQKLSLEGDFDSYFSLYAPKEYERDALYIFTPDLMTLFIDELGDFDAEIIDDELFIYSSRPFSVTDENILRRIFKIIDTVAAKTLSRSENYSDINIGDRALNIVAEPGRRLKKGFSWLAILIGVIYVIYILYQIFSISNM